jgi:hypothetical protein
MLLIISTLGSKKLKKAALHFVPAKKEEAGKVNTERELLDADVRVNGKRYCCPACLAKRKIAKDELVEEVEFDAAGAIV